MSAPANVGWRIPGSGFLLPGVLALLVGACVSTSSTPAVPETGKAKATLGSPTQSVTFTGGDGLSMEAAVVVHAPNESSGVRAEYTWLREHFPGYKRTMQGVVPTATKQYDVLDIAGPDGTKLKVYFEISEFYGKF